MAEAIKELFVSLAFKVEGVGEFKSAIAVLRKLKPISEVATKKLDKVVSGFKQLEEAAKGAAQAINSIPRIKYRTFPRGSSDTPEAAKEGESEGQRPTAKKPPKPPKERLDTPEDAKEGESKGQRLTAKKPPKLPKERWDTPESWAIWRQLQKIPEKTGPKELQAEIFQEAINKWKKRLSEIRASEGPLTGEVSFEAEALEKRLKKYPVPAPQDRFKQATFGTHKWAQSIHAVRHAINLPGSGLLASLASITTRIHPVVAGVTALAAGFTYAATTAYKLNGNLLDIGKLTDVDMKGFQDAAYTAERYGASVDDVAAAVASYNKAKANTENFNIPFPEAYFRIGVGPNITGMTALERIHKYIQEVEKRGNLDEVNRTRELVKQVGISDKLYIALRRAKSVSEFKNPYALTDDDLRKAQEGSDAWREVGTLWMHVWQLLGTKMAPMLIELARVVSAIIENPLFLLGGVVRGSVEARSFDAVSKGEELPPWMKYLAGAVNPVGFAGVSSLRGLMPAPSQAVHQTTIHNNVQPSVTVNAKTDDPMALARVVNGVVISGYDQAFRQSNLAAAGDATNRP
jgi:hypothetical protein